MLQRTVKTKSVETCKRFEPKTSTLKSNLFGLIYLSAEELT